MTSSDTYQLKWHSHSAHLNGSVAALLRSERFTDVVLCTMDGSQIPAHKFILSSCSVYLSSLFDGQRSVMRMGGMLYVVLPSEISTKALKILVEYMYKGETTVSNEVLDMVLKAGEVLKIRGLWQQSNESNDNADKNADTPTPVPASVAKQPLVKKAEDMLPKLAVKKDDKIIKINQMQTPGGVTRPMFIGPPKLVFIKTAEGTTQAAIRPGAPISSKGQTILVAPAPVTSEASSQSTSASTTTTIIDDSPDEGPPPRIMRRQAVERKYGKRQKTEISVEDTSKAKDDASKEETSKKKRKESPAKEPALSKDQAAMKEPSTSKEMTTEIQIKDEPDWEASRSSIEEEERSIAEMLQAEMNVKSEPTDDVDIEEESLVSSLLNVSRPSKRIPKPKKTSAEIMERKREMARQRYIKMRKNPHQNALRKARDREYYRKRREEYRNTVEKFLRIRVGADKEDNLSKKSNEFFKNQEEHNKEANKSVNVEEDDLLEIPLEKRNKTSRIIQFGDDPISVLIIPPEVLKQHCIQIPVPKTVPQCSIDSNANLYADVTDASVETYNDDTSKQSIVTNIQNAYGSHNGQN